MRALVTGGAGFIGRWVVKALLDRNCEVIVLDNLSNGSKYNLDEFAGRLKEFIAGDIRDEKLLKNIFKTRFDICFHLAARNNVQNSIDDTKETFEVNVSAVFNILEQARKNRVKLVFLSSALVYDAAKDRSIDENHPVKPSCPYTASKIAGENLALSYFYAYRLPVVVLRPFSAYGPFQRTDTEGGVMSIFLKRKLEGRYLEVFGDGRQTRDFFYVEDCSDFIVRAALSAKAHGQIFNAGSGKDMCINKLALFIAGKNGKIKHVPHHHPQSEVRKLICNYNKAKNLLGWAPRVSLNEGIKLTTEWLRK